MRTQQQRIKRVRDYFFLFISLLAVMWVAMCYVPQEEERYHLVISKSTTNRDILRDNRDGCEYIQEKDKPLRPLIVDGVHVCD